jgi:hypothetical protein
MLKVQWRLKPCLAAWILNNTESYSWSFSLTLSLDRHCVQWRYDETTATYLLLLQQKLHGKQPKILLPPKNSVMRGRVGSEVVSPLATSLVCQPLPPPAHLLLYHNLLMYRKLKHVISVIPLRQCGKIEYSYGSPYVALLQKFVTILIWCGLSASITEWSCRWLERNCCEDAQNIEFSVYSTFCPAYTALCVWSLFVVLVTAD